MDGRSLKVWLTEIYPLINPVLQEFPSGSFMIDMDVAGEHWVIEYAVGQGFGLSRQKESGFGWEGVEQSFEKVDELRSALVYIVNAGHTRQT